MVLIDTRGVPHRVRTHWNPFTREYCAYIWVGPVKREKAFSTVRFKAMNDLSKRMWKRNWKVIHENSGDWN